MGKLSNLILEQYIIEQGMSPKLKNSKRRIQKGSKTGTILGDTVYANKEAEDAANKEIERKKKNALRSKKARELKKQKEAQDKLDADAEAARKKIIADEAKAKKQQLTNDINKKRDEDYNKNMYAKKEHETVVVTPYAPVRSNGIIIAKTRSLGI